MILYSLQSLYNSGSVIYVFIPTCCAGKKFGLLTQKKKEVPLRYCPPPPSPQTPPPLPHNQP